MVAGLATYSRMKEGAYGVSTLRKDTQQIQRTCAEKCVGVVLKRFLSVNTKYGIANLRHLVMELDSPIPSLAISS
jgi:hypothetical protein